MGPLRVSGLRAPRSYDSREESSAANLGEEPIPKGEGPDSREDDDGVIHRSRVGVYVCWAECQRRPSTRLGNLQDEDDHGKGHPHNCNRSDGPTQLAQVPRSRLLLAFAKSGSAKLTLNLSGQMRRDAMGMR